MLNINIHMNIYVVCIFFIYYEYIYIYGLYFFEHVNNVRSCSFEYRSLYFIKIKNSYADRSFVAVANARHPSPECDPPHVRGVPPSWTAPAPGGGKRTRRVYTVDVAVGLARMLLPGVPTGDLTQPGAEVHWSKPVRGKSKG